VARGRDTVICLSGACERHDELLEDDGSGYLSAVQRAVTGVAPLAAASHASVRLTVREMYAIMGFKCRDASASCYRWTKRGLSAEVARQRPNIM